MFNLFTDHTWIDSAETRVVANAKARFHANKLGKSVLVIESDDTQDVDAYGQTERDRQMDRDAEAFYGSGHNPYLDDCPVTIEDLML